MRQRGLFVDAPAYFSEFTCFTGTKVQLLTQVRMRQRGLFVDATAYFPGEKLFATISILFEIGATDVLVTPYMRYSIYSLYWYKSTRRTRRD